MGIGLKELLETFARAPVTRPEDVRVTQIEDEEGILLALRGGEVRAYKNQCRHLALPLDDRDPGHFWDSDRRYLVCASHGARYRPDDGLCVDGPCKGSHLKPLVIEVRDGEVFLDTSKLGGFFQV